MALELQTHDRDVPLDPAEGSNVLVLAPSMDAHEDEGCAHLLSSAEATLFVSVTQGPDARLEMLRREGLSPDRVGVVCCETTRGAAAMDGSTGSTMGPVRIETVGSPADLTGLGMRIGEFLSSWDREDVGLCLHSLTPLLQHVDAQRAFRFLHVLTQRVSVSGAVGHYHMDPAAHEERVVAMMRSLCDDTLELRDGEWVST